MKPKLLFNQAVEFHHKGMLPEAERLYLQILSIDPPNLASRHMLGVLRSQQGRNVEALDLISSVLRLRPDNVVALANQANIYNALGRPDEALASYDQALTLRPNFAEGWIGRGGALRELQRFYEALGSYDRALALVPNHAEMLNHRGVVLWMMERFEEALVSIEEALAIKPGFAEAWTNHGNTLHSLGRPGEALESYNRALALDADNAYAGWNKSLCYLLLEQFADAWPLFDLHKKLPVPLESRTYAQPRWSGAQDLKGKTLFVHSEQGLGDILFFYRYLEPVQALGTDIVLAVPNSLMRLLRSALPAVQLAEQGMAPQHFDYHVSLMSLPQIFRTDADTIPGTQPYLRAEPELVRAWAGKIGVKGFKIGICWQGRSRAKMGSRSFPPAYFKRVSEIANTRLISLQKGSNTNADQTPDFPFGLNVEFLGANFDGGHDAFIDAAAVMEALDLIITADTAIAHLAGALGRPVWVVLKYVPDWRWFLGRADSPWYPTMRLFRQQSRGDWRGPFEEIEARVADRASRMGHRGRGSA